MAPISVLVADSQRMFAQAMAWALERFPVLEILSEYPTTGPIAVDTAEFLHPDVVLLDFWLPQMEGPSVAQRVLARLPDCKILMLSWFHGPDEIQRALDAGAAGFLPKNLGVPEVAQAIELAHAGQKPVFPEGLEDLTRKLTRRGAELAKLAKRFEGLTAREIDVLAELAHGAPIEEVAKALMISQSTLKSHIRNILAKTGTRSHSEAVALALSCGLIQI